MISMKECSTIFSIIILIFMIVIILIAYFLWVKKKGKIAFSLLIMALITVFITSYIVIITPIKFYKNNDITKLSILEENNLININDKYVVNNKYSIPEIIYKIGNDYKTVTVNDVFVHYYEVSSEEEMKFEKCIYKVNNYKIFGKDLTIVGFEVHLTKSVLKELGQVDYLSI